MPRTVNPSDFQSKRKEVPDNEYARTIPCNTVNLSAPFHWLALGLHDFVRMPLISAFTASVLWQQRLVLCFWCNGKAHT